MKKRLTSWVIGGLITVSAMGLAFGSNIVTATEKNAVQPSSMHDMMKDGQMGGMDHQMNSPEMQKQCLDMMKNPEMQQAMKDMMKQPEMQSVMKKMLASDPEFRQIMSDLVNSIDPNDQNSSSTPSAGDLAPMPGMDHSGHHSHSS